MRFLEAISYVLQFSFDIMEKHEDLQTMKHPQRYGENDYILKIWGPLVEEIISFNKIIRLKG